MTSIDTLYKLQRRIALTSGAGLSDDEAIREVSALTDALRALEQEPKLIELAAALKRTQDDLRRENWQLDEQVLKWRQRAEQAEAEVTRLRAELKVTSTQLREHLQSEAARLKAQVPKP